MSTFNYVDTILSLYATARQTASGSRLRYKGSGEAAIEVAAGRAQFTVISVLVAQSLIKDGKLVPIVQRHPVLPGVPLIADVVPEWTLVGASAVYAPAGTPLPLRQ